MNRRIYVMASVLFLLLPAICIADEKSDAEASVAEAEKMLGKLNGLAPWVGPALTMKLEAENHLALAKEALNSGDYGKAKEHAGHALDFAKKALGLRAWFLLKISRIFQFRIVRA